MRYRGSSPQSSPRTSLTSESLLVSSADNSNSNNSHLHAGHLAAVRALETPSATAPIKAQQRRSSPSSLLSHSKQQQPQRKQQQHSRPSHRWWPLLVSNQLGKKDDDNNNNVHSSNNNVHSNNHQGLQPSPLLLNQHHPIGMSSSLDDGEAHTVPKFAFREITLGALVGQGGFSDVREIVSVDLDEVFDTSEAETQARRQFARMVNDKSTTTPRKKYVLKSLRNDLPEEEHTKGILDLAIEADFLATLQHANIIALRATANSDPHESRYFVVLDRLHVTLERKFNLWRKIVGDASGIYVPCYGYCCSKSHVLHNLWKERLEVALQTASAVDYLHEKGIVYRDLKPDNIGFDGSDGTVKLFDFGLAKRLQDAEKAPDNGHPAFSGLYHLTGNTGSLRYMAPEVAKCLPYDQSVDAYSFGILFWQICSLTTPYAKYSTKMHAERVLQKGHRPKPDNSWPPTWVQLQTSCWSTDRSFRPPFSQIVSTLQEQLNEMEDGVVPSRASEIKAKKKKKRVASDALDVDTRKAPPADDSEVQKRYDGDIV